MTATNEKFRAAIVAIAHKFSEAPQLREINVEHSVNGGIYTSRRHTEMLSEQGLPSWLDILVNVNYGAIADMGEVKIDRTDPRSTALLPAKAFGLSVS